MKKNLPSLTFTVAIFLVLSVFATAFSYGETNSEAQITLRTPEMPGRIVVMPIFAEEMLLEMIGPERIVGVWHEYYENGSIYTPTMALTKNMQHGLSIDDAESILALAPDLVVLYKGNFYDYTTLLPALEESCIPALFLETPANFNDVISSLTLLGEVVGAREKADEMVIDVETRLRQLAEIVSNIPEKKRMRVTHYQEHYPLSVYDVIADAASVISDRGTVFKERHSDHLEIDDQLLAEWNPDLITITAYSTDTDGSILDIGDQYTDRYSSYLLNDKDLSSVAAIKNRNIHPLGIYTSQYMVKSATDLAKLAYPDLFPKQE